MYKNKNRWLKDRRFFVHLFFGWLFVGCNRIGPHPNPHHGGERGRIILLYLLSNKKKDSPLYIKSIPFIVKF